MRAIPALFASVDDAVNVSVLVALSASGEATFSCAQTPISRTDRVDRLLPSVGIGDD